MSGNQERVLKWFENHKGRAITLDDAGRIFNMHHNTFTKVFSVLRQLGHALATEWRKNPITGRWYKVYFMH